MNIITPTKIKTSLTILPHFNFAENLPILQKCVIPSEIFPDDIKFKLCTTVIAKCENSFNKKQYICKLRSLYNNYPSNYCHIDESVSLFRNECNREENLDLQIERQPKITSIEILDYDEEPTENVSVVVTISENALKTILNIFQAKSILQNILQAYILTEDAYIKCDPKDIELYGFSYVHVIKSSSKSYAFKIGPETNLEIIDFKFNNGIELSKRIRTDLEDLDEISLELEKLISDIKLRNELNWNIKPSLMTLIYGLSGSGKTSLCNNFFIRSNCNVFEIIPASIIGQYPGETEEQLRRIFQNVVYFASRFKPKNVVVIFIENIELICSSNKTNSTSENVSAAHSSRISKQFLTLLDLLHQKDFKILVIGTTSNIEAVDLSLRRPGRFENEISIPLLSEKGRTNMIKKFLKNLDCNFTGDDLENASLELGKKTSGFVGADIKLLIHNFSRRIMQLECCKNDEKDLNGIKIKFEEVLKTMKPSSLKSSDITCVRCDKKLESIGGMDNLKKILRISVLAALENPEIFRKFGLELPKGILLYGPPGCAKTTIAKCLAAETQMRFISISGAEVYSPYVGKAEKFISKIFDTARKNSPCLIFLDEIDTLIGNRSVGSNNDVQTRVLSTLLQEMDGIGLRISNCYTKNVQVLICAATNRPDLIDNALMRPGRFDKLIHVSAPDFESRLAIFELHKNVMPISDNVNFENLAKLTDDYSGADICNLCNEAAINALTVHPEIEQIFTDDFIKVMEKFKPSLTKKQIEWYYNFEKRFIE